jgi:hypothetical protein
MATTAATLAVKVTADASQASRELSGASGSVSKFQTGLGKASVAAAGVAVGLTAFGTAAFDAASKAEQSAGAVDAVFGKTAKAVHKFAEDSASSTGLAGSEYEAMAATFGAQLKNMGTAQKDLAPQTNDLIELGADLAAQFGGSTSDAVAALSSLLRGETDPIEKYGISIKQADIEAKKAEMGLGDLTGAADKAATKQATLALLTEQSATAQGAFAREADTAAGAQARASAQWEDAQVALGQVLLPVVSKAAELFSGLATFVEDNATAFQTAAFVIGGLAAAVLAVNVATKAWTAAQTLAKVASTAWTAAQWLLNAALSANPIGLVVTAVAGLVAGLVLAYKKSDRFRKIVDTVARFCVKAFKSIVRVIGTVVEAIRKAISWIGPKLSAAFKIAKKVGIVAIKAYLLPLKIAVEAVRLLVRVLSVVLPAAWRIAKQVAQTVARAITAAVGWVIDKVRALIGWVKDTLSGAWRTMKDVARTVLDWIRTPIGWVIDKVKALIGWVKDTLSQAWRDMKAVARTALDFIRTPIQWVIDKVKALIGWVDDTLATAWDTMSTAADTALDALLSPIQWVIDKVEDLVGWIGNISFPEPPGWMKDVGGFLGGIMPGSFAAPSTAPAVATRGRTTRSAGAAGGIVINVNGALDPDAVARQIERILTGRSRRVGGVHRLTAVG